MGCCLSTNHASQPAKSLPQIGGKSQPSGNPMLEEETVKEVLSETPTIPRHCPSLRIPKENSQIESPFIKIAPLLDFSRTAHDKRYKNGVVCKKPFTAFGNEDVSEEVSEICSSLSESVSASTEKRGYKGDELRELRQRPPASKNRSRSGEIKREKTVGRSPGRRSESSPNRSGSGYARKRECCGESSGRRSRSPVTRLDPTPPKVARKTGRSPARVGSGLGDRTRKLEDDNPWAPLPTSNNESLENPLVSLECFIFL